MTALPLLPSLNHLPLSPPAGRLHPRHALLCCVDHVIVTIMAGRTTLYTS